MKVFFHIVPNLSWVGVPKLTSPSIVQEWSPALTIRTALLSIQVGQALEDLANFHELPVSILAASSQSIKTCDPTWYTTKYCRIQCVDYDLSIFEDIPCGPVWYENALTVIQMQSCWHCPTDGEALLSSPEPDDPQDAEAAAGEGNAWAQCQFSYLSKSNPHGFGQYLAVNHANSRVGSQLATRTTFSLWKSIVARYQAGSGEELQIQRN